jgi:hypothetical protein
MRDLTGTYWKQKTCYGDSFYMVTEINPLYFRSGRIEHVCTIKWLNYNEYQPDTYTINEVNEDTQINKAEYDLRRNECIRKI